MSGPKSISFFARANNLEARDLPSRISRFVRAKLRRWSAAGMLLADDPRVLQAWKRGWDAPHFIHLHRWREEGFRPEVIYDIGSNEGIWSEMCQHVLEPKACYLFEPQLEFEARAMARQPKAGARWEMLPVALGDREEIEVLHVTQNSAASSLLRPLDATAASVREIQEVSQNKVSVIPLDTLVKTRGLPLPDLVKIDVQGFEGRVLAGAEATLRHAKRIVVEVSLQPLYQDQSLLPGVLELLVRWGFQLDDINETFRQWPGRLWQVDLWLRRP